MKALRIVLTLLTVLGSTVAMGDPVRLALKDQNFTPTVDMNVSYCVGPNDRCMASKLFKANIQASCRDAVFITATTPDPAFGIDKACYGVPATSTPAPATAWEDRCWPEIKLNFWDMDFEWGKIPDTVSTRYWYYVVWREKPVCGTRTGGQFRGDVFGKQDLEDFAEARPKNDAEFNAWAKARPITGVTDQERAYVQAKLVAFKLKLSPPVVTPPPAPACTVAYTSAGTRPYGTPTSAGTGINKKGDIAVGSLCDAKTRLGATNYYSVAGQKDTLGRTIPAGNYANGSVP